MSDDVPRAFGRYRVTRVLGQGAMGSVYVAQDDVLGREVAVKTIRPTALPIGGAERFVHEGRAAAQLAHAHIVRVFDVGTEAGMPYLVMELAGGALKDRIERGPLPVAEVRKLGIQITQALGAAHELGIVHRDVKPANILEAANGMWKLADFGIAHLPDSTLTLAGQFLGSPAYAAPESVRGGVFVPASDVYALAATLFEAATGRQLHEGGIEGRLRTADPSSDVQRSRLLDVDAPGLVEAIARGLAPQPHERPTAAEMAGLIAEAAAVPSVPSPVTPPKGVETVALGGTQFIADSMIGPPPAQQTQFVADSRVGPPPPSRNRAIAIGAAIAVAAVIAIAVAANRSRSGPEVARDAGSQVGSDARIAAPDADELPLEPGEPPLAEGELRIVTPRIAIERRDASKEWGKLVDKIYEGHYDAALDKLDRWDHKFGASAETRSLRAQLVKIREQGRENADSRDDDGE